MAKKLNLDNKQDGFLDTPLRYIDRVAWPPYACAYACAYGDGRGV